MSKNGLPLKECFITRKTKTELRNIYSKLVDGKNGDKLPLDKLRGKLSTFSYSTLRKAHLQSSNP